MPDRFIFFSRLYLLLWIALILLSSCTITAFTTTTLMLRLCRQQKASPLRMAPLSNEEIFARAQQHRQQKEAAAAETNLTQIKLFDDEMLTRMQKTLLLLEERAKGGEGALAIQQIDQLEDMLGRIISEMKQNEHLRPSRQPRTPTPPTTTHLPSPPPPPSTPQVATIGAAPMIIDRDTPSDEGPAYQGRGGMGQAADTTNTYVIPGMDEMEPEEYQKALQQSVIERQKQRRSTGVTGNRSSWDYINSLTGESGVLKKKGSH